MRELRMVAREQLELVEVEPPAAPEARSVEVEVDASGLALTQLQLLDGTLDAGELPRVFGHEIVGRVARTGEDAVAPPAGTRVLVDPLVGCGVCAQCLAGRESICASHRFIGFDVDGGYTERVVVPDRQLFTLPPGIGLGEAVLLNSAVAVAVHAVRSAGVQPGDSVAVLGAGSVGVLVCQVARAFGATRVVAADIAEESIERASRYADAALDIAGLEPQEVAAELGGHFGDSATPQVVFEAAGQHTTLDAALALVGSGGLVLLLGLCGPGTALRFDDYVGEVILREITLRSVYAYDRRVYPPAIELFRSGAIDVGPLVGDTLDLAEVPAMVERMRADGVGGVRHVVRPTPA